MKPDGTINTIAGNGIMGFGGNGGPATAASLYTPTGTLLLPSGDLLIADLVNHQVRKVSPAGVITAFAGTGIAGFSGDGGAATAARLNHPYGLATDVAGNIYVADQYNHRIRKISPAGIITTVAGTGTAAYSGDGGPASAAKLSFPNYIYMSSSGDLFVTDNGNHVIRKISVAGTISTIAGNGIPGASGDGGPATAARLNYPAGLTMDSYGNLYVAGNVTNNVRKISTSGIITSIAGTGIAGFSGDGGAATTAQLSMPLDITFNAAGDLLVADYGNNRVRKIAGFAPTGIPVFTGPHPSSISYCVTEAVTGYTVDTLMKANDPDVGQTLTWSLVTPPSHGTAVISYSTLSTGGTVTPIGLTYTPTLGYVGADAYSVRVSDGVMADTISVNVTMETSPAAGVVSGADTVCQGSTISLSGSVSGTWSTITGMAGVSAGGVVSGITPGADTIALTVSNSCGSAITLHPVWVRAASDCSAGLTDVSAPEMVIYPNPGHGHFVMQVKGSSGVANIAIYNIVGQAIKKFTIAQGGPVDVELDIACGVYLVVATSTENTAVSRLVIDGQ